MGLHYERYVTCLLAIYFFVVVFTFSLENENNEIQKGINKKFMALLIVIIQPTKNPLGFFAKLGVYNFFGGNLSMMNRNGQSIKFNITRTKCHGFCESNLPKAFLKSKIH